MGIQVRPQEEKSQTSVPAPNPPKFKAVYPAASYMHLIVRLSLRGGGVCVSILRAARFGN